MFPKYEGKFIMKHNKFLICRLCKEFCKDEEMAGITHFGFGCGIKIKDVEPALEALETNIFWDFRVLYSFCFHASYFILDKNTDEIRSTVDFRLGFFWFFWKCLIKIMILQ